MTQTSGIKGGKIRVLLDPEGTGTYAAPCGFRSRSITINKGLQEVSLPDCDNPDEITWMGRDATDLSMSVSGEGVLATESVETWLDAIEDADPVAAKIEWEFPTKTITWTGFLHISSFAVTGENNRTATATAEMASDGKMTRVVS